jgi:hypothetical protein
MMTTIPIFMDRSRWIHNVNCTTCNSPIIGYRFFCTLCAVSICESCEQRGNDTSTTNYFYKYFYYYHSCMILLSIVPIFCSLRCA